MIVFRPQYLNNTRSKKSHQNPKRSSWFPAGGERETQNCIHAFYGRDCIACLERKYLFMSLIVVLCFFNFFMSYRWPCSSIQHYQPIEWVKCRSPFENKDTVLTFILGRNESCTQLSYTKGKYFKFYKDRTIHKILVEGKHQTQQLPFQWQTWAVVVFNTGSLILTADLSPQVFSMQDPSCTTQW